MKTLIKLKINNGATVPYFTDRANKWIFSALLGLKAFRFYSSKITYEDNLQIVPAHTYLNADTDKFAVLEDNRNKVGVYRWVNILTGKSYVGSSKNLSSRFRQYFNIVYLENQIKNNNSNIYRSLIKNGYSKFRLEILEYCELHILIEREQYYLDILNPEYNILKIAGSLTGFKHSEATKELMSINKLNSTLSEETKLKIATALSKGEDTIVLNMNTKDRISFVSIRKAAEYIGVHPSYVARAISLNKFYLDKTHLIYKSNTTEDNILNSEVYKEAVGLMNGTILKIKHTEASKELIRKANLGKKLSQNTIQKLSLNSKNAKAVLITNSDTGDTLEFSSAVSAGKYLGVDESYIRRCITNNKLCRGYTIARIAID